MEIFLTNPSLYIPLSDIKSFKLNILGFPVSKWSEIANATIC